MEKDDRHVGLPPQAETSTVSLDVGRIIRQAVRLCYANPTRFIIPAALIGLPAVASTLIQLLLFRESSFGTGAGQSSMWALALVIFAFVLHVYYAATVPVLTLRLLNGRSMSWIDALRWVRRNRLFWGLVMVMIIVAFSTAIGLILLIVPGIILATWFVLAEPALVLGDFRAIDAMLESQKLIQPVFWNGLLLAILKFLPLLFVAVGFNYLVPSALGIQRTSEGLAVTTSMISFLIGALWTPVISVTCSIVYIERTDMV